MANTLRQAQSWLLSGRPKTANCFVSEKIQIAYVCTIHCAPWIFSLPCISPFLNGLLARSFSTADLPGKF
jgi:hypothetical protein